ncbi:MAG: response regulator [Chloroflexi bacterium]|nr:response regulator [Chloroflexota bacterium]
MSQRPLLIVDDDVDHAVIARTVAGMVAPAAAVETCLDARAARARVLNAPEAAVVLIDRLLDGVESIALLAEVAGIRPDLYIVLLSASLSAEDRERALNAGAREATGKPGSLAAWRSLVEGVMARSSGGSTESGRDALAG